MPLWVIEKTHPSAGSIAEAVVERVDVAGCDVPGGQLTHCPMGILEDRLGEVFEIEEACV